MIISLILLPIATSFVSVYIVANSIIASSNIDPGSISSLFLISNISQIFAMLLAGNMLDKFGIEVTIKIRIIAKIIAYISLIIGEPCITHFFVFYGIALGFIYGPSEATIYKESLENQSPNIIQTRLAQFYLSTDSAKILAHLLTMYVITFGRIYVILYLILQIISCIFIFRTFKIKTKIHIQKNYLSDLIRHCKIVLENKKTRYSIILFALYASFLYTGSQTLIILAKASQIDPNKFALYKTLNNVFLAIGCLIPILFNKIINQYASFIRQKMPIMTIAILILSLYFPFYITCIAILIITTSNCMFEVISDVKIDSSIKIENIGMANSIIWLITLSIAACASGFISFLSQYLHIKNALAITFATILLIFYLNNKKLNQQ